MSHILFIIAQLIPWYLFPGTAPADTTKKIPIVQTPAAAQDSLLTKEFRLDIPETINVSIAMPLNGSVSGNIDFYCGALLAARDLGEQKGIRINLHAHDTGKEDVNASMIATSDVFLGPISFTDVLNAAGECPGDKVIISPLEQKVSALTDSLHIVQTPTRQEDQLRELARWAAEDRYLSDIVVILEDHNDTSSVIMNELDRLGVKYSRSIGCANLGQFCRKDASTRFIIGSDKEAFNCAVVRCVSVLALEKKAVTLYCPSKVRSYENLNVELLHNAGAHITTNYFVDYDSFEVRDFVFRYRALFKTEPNSFAFHGYDTMKYFTELCSTYGREWFKKLSSFHFKGLQSDFSFCSTNCGAINHACRRIIYNSDFTISVR